MGEGIDELFGEVVEDGPRDMDTSLHGYKPLLALEGVSA